MKKLELGHTINTLANVGVLVGIVNYLRIVRDHAEISMTDPEYGYEYDELSEDIL